MLTYGFHTTFALVQYDPYRLSSHGLKIIQLLGEQHRAKVGHVPFTALARRDHFVCCQE